MRKTGKGEDVMDKKTVKPGSVLIDKDELYKEMKKASEDPLFMEDLEKSMADFSR